MNIFINEMHICIAWLVSVLSFTCACFNCTWIHNIIQWYNIQVYINQSILSADSVLYIILISNFRKYKMINIKYICIFNVYRGYNSNCEVKRDYKTKFNDKHCIKCVNITWHAIWWKWKYIFGEINFC